VVRNVEVQYMQQSISVMIELYQGILRVIPQMWRGLFAWTFSWQTSVLTSQSWTWCHEDFPDIYFLVMKLNPNGESFCNWHSTLKSQCYWYLSPGSVSVNQMKPESITVNSQPPLPIKLNPVTKNFVTEEKFKAWRLCHKN
jgi:hypothetical protein